MRENIRDVSLTFLNQKIMIFFYKSLRFSTHCKYSFYSPFKPVFDSGYNYIVQNDWSKIGEAPKALRISIDKEGSIGRNTAESYHHQSPNCQGKILTHFFLDGVENHLAYLFTAHCSHGVVLSISTDANIEIDNSNFEVEPFIKPAILVVEEFEGAYSTRHFCADDLHILELARLYGINIPLMLIQDILRRKISVTCMVDSENVCHETLQIVLDQKELFFDLDETLIWDGNEVPETKKLLKSSREAGRKNSLITRHQEADIIPTLSSIGLSEGDFAEIIFVNSGELKSSFIGSDAVFIDNEYPERLDVRSQTTGCALDVDVIDRIVFV